jgi:predicted TIM-barrel fold metal-dependent hydrolase
MRTYNAISADSHLECSPEPWTQRLPASLRSDGPRTIRVADGTERWVIGDNEPRSFGLSITGGKRFDEFAVTGGSYSAGLPGTGGPEQRVAEQELDGVDAELLYSSLPAAAMKLMKDPNLVRHWARAYNDWLSEYCSFAPHRLFGAAIMPTSGVEDAVAELQRVARMPGIRGAWLLRFPDGGEWSSALDEAFWAAAADLQMTVTVHHNFGGEDKGKAHGVLSTDQKAIGMEGPADLTKFAWLLTSDLQMPTLPILTIEQLFLSGVFDRNPSLRLHFAEAGAGWLAYWLEQIDDRADRHRFWANVTLKQAPSQYVRDHVTFSFQEDHVGVATRHMIGVNNICWASDFPHSVSDWPWSREVRARLFKDVPDSDRRRIEALNIAEWLSVITPAEKEALARQPRVVQDPADVRPRRERRLPALAAV